MAATKYKDSGIPWIGMIPSDWEVCFTKQLMRNKSIKGFPDEQVLSLYRDFGVVPKDSRDDNHNVTSEDTASYKLVEVGDFVINKMKAWQGSMAISAYRGIISPAYYICRFTNDSVNRRYIHYLLRNETYKTEYRRLSTGLRVGQWDLNIDDFLHIPAILPPPPTQQRIADYLDRKCAEIDELAALQETMIAELKRYKQSVITEAVTKGLDPNVPMKDSGVEWIGEIPEGWKVLRANEVANYKKGPFGSAITKDMFIPKTNDSIKVYEQQNAIKKDWQLGYYYISRTYFEDNLRGFEVLPNDIIVSCAGTIGEMYVMPICIEQGIINQALMRIRLTDNDINMSFFLYLFDVLLKSESDKSSNGTAIKNIPPFNILKKIKLGIPPLTEQRAIADYLDQKCAEIDELIAIKQQKIESLKEYKKSVIFEYVTGKKEI